MLWYWIILEATAQTIMKTNTTNLDVRQQQINWSTTELLSQRFNTTINRDRVKFFTD
jgi:hypothetical protein